MSFARPSRSDVSRSLGGQFDDMRVDPPQTPARARPSDVDSRGGSGSQAGSSSQATKRKRPQNDEDDVVPAYIKSIRMNNFMCHNDKIVPLQPRMNLISGVNGSGKSATVVALSICLGAKGKDTNRADTLSDFIGTYANQAILEVKIAIHPSNAVHLGDYELKGDLLVTRTLRKSGQNELKISLCHGDDPRNMTVTKISPGRGRAKPSDDLKYIMDQLNIQVDNPIQVMHQDKTKTFLASAQSDKFNKYYELFSRATGLQELAEQLDETRQCMVQVDDEMASMKQALEAFIKDKFVPAETEYKETEEMRNCSEKISRLKIELMWINVREQEEALAANEDELVAARDKLSDYLLREDAARDLLASCNEKRLQTSEEVKNFVVREKEVSQRVSESKKRHLEAAAALRKAELSRQQCVKDVDGEKREIQKLKASREDMLMQADRARAEKQGRSVSCLRELETTLGELAAKRQQAGSDLDQKSQELEVCKQEVDDAKSQLKDHKGDLDRANRDLTTLKNSSVSKLGLFGGPNVEKIADAVGRNASKFQGSVIGPVGKYIKVKDEDAQWRMALADAVNIKTCQTYLVDNQRDSETLKALVGSLRLQGAANQAPSFRANKDHFEGADVHGPEKTLWDVIDIAHPDPEARRCIGNFLIDAAKVNELRLCDGYDAARANTDTSRPLRTVTLPNGVRHTPSRDSYYIDGTDRTRKMWIRGKATGSTPVRHNDIFPVDLASAERDVEGKIVGLKKEAERAEGEVRRAEQEMGVKRKGAADAKKLVFDIGQEMSKVEKKKAEEEAKEQQDEEAEYMVEVGVVERELLKRQEDVDKKEQEALPALDEEVEKQKELASEAEKVFKEAKKEADKIEEDAKSLKKNDVEVNKGKNDAERDLVRLEQKIATKRKDIEEKDQAKRHKEGELETSMEAMSDVGDKVDTDRSRREVSKEIDGLSKHLEKRQQQSSKRADEVSRRYKEALVRKEAQEKACGEYEGLMKGLMEGWKHRNKRRKVRQREVGLHVGTLFDDLLGVKNFSGRLVLDHKGHTMQPVVYTSRGHGRRGGDPEVGKTKELSGGERSISTLCLVLALAQASETPLVVLDEFDVFMDEANRATSLLILVNQRRHEASQTILVSPHSTAILPDAPDIHKFKMPPIDRGQRVLTSQSEASQA
eukprot:CAMPEP_0173420232 /NCGR_PEP_ID=MMETSP1357-20121228/1809_1 /TAXON_ID=77926 /ORGANISM="Hemiselmis rufescens, Strain PCC563" /LENGTH=1160 /DNA_ID=CAMNT_0014383007 /DNA_START=59 /DNA_END=3537 /DNA_ORIENTATION=-